MTPEKQRTVIAEACGWTREVRAKHLGDSNVDGWSKGGYFTPAAINLPDYLGDLNAMHEAEIAAWGIDWDEEPWARYKQNLYGVIEMNRHVLNATAAQRAEAFLRTIGKWEESA